MPKQSAGILLYRTQNAHLEVLLGHPGGPFFSHKDLGVWSIPKGEFKNGETPLDAAKREFEEETGMSVEGDFIELGILKQRSGKIVHAFALEGDCDADTLVSNTFFMKWPPIVGKMQEFPELDRAAWFSIEEAQAKITSGQAEFLQRLEEQLKRLSRQ